MLQLGHITSVSNQQLSPQTLFPHTLFQEEIAAVESNRRGPILKKAGVHSLLLRIIHAGLHQ